MGGGSGNALDEVVDVDVVRLQLGEDALELAHRVRVPELVELRVGVSHRPCSAPARRPPQ